jgi:hypothetical protein
MKRILFVGALHHPEALQAQQSDARQRGAPVPLFPATNMYHFYEKELRRRGYVLDVFWRNLPAHAQNDPSAARAERFTEGLTLRKLWQGALNRLPPQWQPALRARNAALLRHVERFQPEIVWLIGAAMAAASSTPAAHRRSCSHIRLSAPLHGSTTGRW